MEIENEMNNKCTKKKKKNALKSQTFSPLSYPVILWLLACLTCLACLVTLPAICLLAYLLAENLAWYLRGTPLLDVVYCSVVNDGGW